MKRALFPSSQSTFPMFGLWYHWYEVDDDNCLRRNYGPFTTRKSRPQCFENIFVRLILSSPHNLSHWLHKRIKRKEYQTLNKCRARGSPMHRRFIRMGLFLIWQDAMALQVSLSRKILFLSIELELLFFFFCLGFIPSTYVGFTTAAFSPRIWPTV